MARVSSSPLHRTRDRRPRRRRRRLLPTALRLLALLVVFGLGVALGEAYGDRPRPVGTATVDRDVRQVTVTESVARRTVTVVVSTGAP
jgi:hypothetical protein